VRDKKKNSNVNGDVLSQLWKTGSLWRLRICDKGRDKETAIKKTIHDHTRRKKGKADHRLEWTLMISKIAKQSLVALKAPAYSGRCVYLEDDRISIQKMQRMLINVMREAMTKDGGRSHQLRTGTLDMLAIGVFASAR
jgi:hypothetical protein